jgi:hypothetical protein
LDRGLKRGFEKLDMNVNITIVNILAYNYDTNIAEPGVARHQSMLSSSTSSTSSSFLLSFWPLKDAMQVSFSLFLYLILTYILFFIQIVLFLYNDNALTMLQEYANEMCVKHIIYHKVMYWRCWETCGAGYPQGIHTVIPIALSTC